MIANANSQERKQHYEIRVQGHLDGHWEEWLGDMQISHEPRGTTALRGSIEDQAALHGLLAKLRDLGVPIVSVGPGDADDLPAGHMYAMVAERYGSPDVLERRVLSQPTPTGNEVLVRVHAAGVDRGVWHLVTGLPYLVRAMGYGLRKPKNPVPGLDFAGEVVAVGASVTKFRAGDRVFGTCGGAFAQYACASEANIAPIPTGLDYVQAAALPVSGLAALQAVHDEAKVQPGDSALVIGASGGVGSYAVQIAKASGAEVTGVCSTAKADFVRSIGADHVIDYTHEDVTSLPKRYDVIVDLAGNRPLSRLRRILAPNGTLVIAGGEDGGRWFGGQGRPLRASLMSPFVGQRLRWQLPRGRPGALDELAGLVAANKVRPFVDRTYPLVEAAEAIGALVSGRATGKLVVTI